MKKYYNLIFIVLILTLHLSCIEQKSTKKEVNKSELVSTSQTDTLKFTSGIRAEQWVNKPLQIKRGTKVIAKETTDSITEGKEYVVMGHFATLVTTIYSSEWKQFITFKNKYGWTVKMNLRKFILPTI